MEDFKNENIDRLEREELELMRNLARNREEQREIKTRAWLHDRNLKLDDAVMYHTTSYGKTELKEGKLFKFEYRGAEPVAVVKLFNSDGNIGKIKKTLSSEEMKTVVKI